MGKKNVLLLNYFQGSRVHFESPVFYGNALYWLEAYLETFDDLTAQYRFKMVNFKGMNLLNHGVSSEENINVLNAVFSERPAIVAFSLYVWNVGHAHELAAVIKEMAPEVLIIAGGPEVYERSDFCRDFPAFDVLVEGDGEVPFKAVLLSLADGKDLSSVKNVSYRKNGGFFHNEPDPVFPDIEEVPNFYETEKSLITGRGFYLTTRGCPYQCHMCLWARQPMRRKSNARILEELRSLIVGTDLRFLTLFDYDLLEAYHEDTGFFRALEEMVRQRSDGFGINFFINTKYMEDPRLGDLIDRLNTNHVIVGLQSTCPESLHAINRGWSVSHLEVLDKVDPALRHHFHVELIFPLPEQTTGQFVDSLKRLLKMGYFRIKVFQLCVLRGTALYRKREELGLKYQSTPPYTCYQTPLVSMQDSLRIGVLAYILDVVRDIADSFQDEQPFIDYFTRSADVVDRILERIDKNASSDEIARHLVRDILGVDYEGSFFNAEYKDGAAGRPSLLEVYKRTSPEDGGPPMRLEEEIREFFSGLGVKDLTIRREPNALGLQVDRDGRRLEIIIFPRRLSRPYFKSTRFYKVACSGGGQQDIDLVERTIGFIRELEGRSFSL